MKCKNIKEFRILAEIFFKACKDSGQPPTVSGLAVALGTSRFKLLNLRQGSLGVAAEEALSVCEAYVEARLLEGKNVTGAMFILKNNFNWNEKSDLPPGEKSIEIIIKHPWEKFEENGNSNSDAKPTLAA